MMMLIMMTITIPVLSPSVVRRRRTQLLISRRTLSRKPLPVPSRPVPAAGPGRLSTLCWWSLGVLVAAGGLVASSATDKNLLLRRQPSIPPSEPPPPLSPLLLLLLESHRNYLFATTDRAGARRRCVANSLTPLSQLQRRRVHVLKSRGSFPSPPFTIILISSPQAPPISCPVLLFLGLMMPAFLIFIFHVNLRPAFGFIAYELV